MNNPRVRVSFVGRPETIGDLFLKARIDKGISLRRLALHTGLDFSAIGRIEAGANEPRLSTAAKLAAALGIAWSDLAHFVQAGGVAEIRSERTARGADLGNSILFRDEFGNLVRQTKKPARG